MSLEDYAEMTGKPIDSEGNLYKEWIRYSLEDGCVSDPVLSEYRWASEDPYSPSRRRYYRRLLHRELAKQKHHRYSLWAKEWNKSLPFNFYFHNGLYRVGLDILSENNIGVPGKDIRCSTTHTFVQVMLFWALWDIPFYTINVESKSFSEKYTLRSTDIYSYFSNRAETGTEKGTVNLRLLAYKGDIEIRDPYFFKEIFPELKLTSLQLQEKEKI